MSTFDDMLSPGEVVIAELAGAGKDQERWHIGLTPGRVLAIRMRPAPGEGGQGRWDVASRTIAPRAQVRIAHFPRGGGDTARLSIDGCGDRIVLLDVDVPPLLQQVTTFLAAWGGPVAGGDTVPHEEVDGYHGQADNKTLMYVVGAMAALFVLCCGCSACAGVLRIFLRPFFG